MPLLLLHLNTENKAADKAAILKEKNAGNILRRYFPPKFFCVVPLRGKETNGMEFYRKLYVGASVTHPRVIRQKLLLGKGRADVYLVTLSASSDQLDIFHSGLLKQRFYAKDGLKIAGLAGSREEALELVQKILKDTLRETGEADMKHYLLEHWGENETQCLRPEQKPAAQAADT